MPEGQGAAHAHIQRVLRALLRNLHAHIAGIHHVLAHTIHLMARHNGIFLPLLHLKPLQAHRILHQLKGAHRVSPALQILHSLESVGAIAPGHSVLRAKRRLVNLHRGRRGSDAAEHQLLHTESIGSAENRTYIIETADIVEHHHQRQFLAAAILLRGSPVHIKDCFFLHILQSFAHKVTKSQRYSAAFH